MRRAPPPDPRRDMEGHDAPDLGRLKCHASGSRRSYVRRWTEERGEPAERAPARFAASLRPASARRAFALRPERGTERLLRASRATADGPFEPAPTVRVMRKAMDPLSLNILKTTLIPAAPRE